MRPLACAIALCFAASLSSRAEGSVIVGSEQAVSAVNYGPPPNQQYPFATASDGSAFVVLWAGAGNSFYASLLSSTGESSPTSQVRLAVDNASDGSICWTGEVYVITWIQSATLMIATMARDGGMLTPPRPLATQVFTSAGTLVSNGKTVFLVYATGTGMVVQGMLLDSEGNLLRQKIQMPIAQFDGAGGRLTLPLRVATDGDRFAVFWRTDDYVSQRTTFYTARIDAGGSLVDTTPSFIGQSGLGDFVVASAQGRYVVATLDRMAKGIRRFIVDAASFTAAALPVIQDDRFGPQLISDGKGFILYGLGPAGDLYTVRFSGDAELASPLYSRSLAFSSERSTSTPFLWNGKTFLLTWSQNGDVVGSFLDASFSGPAAPFAIGFSPHQQLAPRIARGSGQSLIVWNEQNSDSQSEIRGVRVSATGMLIDLLPLTIATGPWFSTPTVVFTGAGYFVSWISSEGMVRGRLLNLDGTMMPFQNIGRGRSVALAASATVTVAVFDDGNINAVRLTPGGEKIDGTPIVLASSRGYGPRIASNGTDFLVVWTEGQNPIFLPRFGTLDVYGARLHADGSRDAAPTAIAVGPGEESSPAVASDGRDYLVAYQNGSILAKRILAEGSLADSTADQPGVLLSKGYGNRPDIVATEGGYYVAWDQPTPIRQELMVIRTDRSGQPEGEPFSVATTTAAVGTTSSLQPALGSISGQQLIVAYDRVFDDARSPAVARVFFRLFRYLGEPRRRTIRH